MSPSEYRDAIKSLGLSLAGVSRLFGTNERTARRWADDAGPNTAPRAVAICLRLMRKFGLGPADVENIMSEKEPKQ